MTARRLLAAATLGALLAACSHATQPSTTAPTSLPPWRADAAYLTVVRGHGIDDTDGQLLETARTICADIDAGKGLLDVVVYAQQRHHLAAPDAGFLVGAAIRAECPEHLATIAEKP